jgi:hypothetical protein
MTVNVSVSLASAVEALRLADRFNLAASNVPGKEKVAAVLTQAVDFLDGISGKLTSGWEMLSGNAWNWDDPFLDAARARDIGADKAFTDPVERAFYDATELSSSSFRLEDGAAAKLRNIRKALNFSSDAEAARLAITAYAELKDGLWRGNGFYFKKGGQQAAFDEKPYLPKP